MQTYLDQTAGVWDSESGEFLNSDHQRLAEILKDYNPYMSLVWIPTKNRDDTDTKPYAILSEIPGKPRHIVRYLSEMEMRNPAEVLAWVFEGDVTRHRPEDIISRIESRERAQKLMDLKKQQEDAEARMDFVAFAASDRSPNYMRHAGKIFRK